MTGDQPAILPSFIVTGALRSAGPTDRAEEDHVGRRAALLGTLGPIARAVLQVELTAARDLFDGEVDARSRPHDAEHTQALGEHLRTCSITGKRDDVYLHGTSWGSATITERHIRVQPVQLNA